jgi:acetolactate synthase I/II/III large subunit
VSSNGQSGRTGGELIVAALHANRVDTVYCVPGESFLPVLDAFYDRPSIRVVTCRHEAGAANMAEADGKMTGRPGICFVTRGPGSTHASTGVHTAMQDSTPMILFVGQVARGMRGREAFQEVDYRQMFGGLAKWAAEIDDPARVPELVARAFHVAMSGRPGPVVLALPEDVLHGRADGVDLAPVQAVSAHPGADDLARLRDMLAAAERPLMILGGSGWDADACEAIRTFARDANVPAACGFRRQALFDNRDEHYAGDVGIAVDPVLAKRVREADVLFALGTRLSEATTSGYTLVEAPRPRQRLIHVHADPNELGRVFEPDLAINAGPAHMAHALARAGGIDGSRWEAWRRDARRDYERNRESSVPAGALDLAAIVRGLSETLPEDAVICNGAGNFAAWVHRFFQYKRFGTQLAPTSGAMGYGVPAAVSAKLRHPERTVVAFAGDGDFSMSAHELATAVQFGAPIVVVIVNNGMLGTIRMHQEREYPGRVIATELRNPDFVALARAYGAWSQRVETTAEFEPAFAEACAAGVPAVIELRVDPETISTRTTLTALRAKSTR